MTDSSPAQDAPAEPSKTSNPLDANEISPPTVDVDPIDDDEFAIAPPEPKIHIIKHRKGYYWMLVSSAGKKIAISAEPRPRLRDINEDIVILQEELPIATIIKRY